MAVWGCGGGWQICTEHQTIGRKSHCNGRERERERIGVAIRVEANLEWPVLFRLNRHGQTLVYIISTDVELV